MGDDQPEQGVSRRGHLQLAAAYTRDAWFPALPHTTAKLKAILNAAGGKIDRELLITELKRDAAVASTLCRVLINSSEAARSGLGAIRTLDSAVLRSAFASDLVGQSKHSISAITPWQQSRFEEAVVAVSAAETLSFAFDADADLAFTCALLRQLGLSLLAWNYPHVFKRALTVIRPGESFEFTLSKILGFSPGFIAVNILRSPDSSPVIMKAVGDTWGGGSLAPEDAAIAARIEALCKVSESMARATSTQAYPSSSADWQSSQLEIETRMGKSGWRILESSITWYLDGYRSLIPDLFVVPKVIADLSAHAKQSMGDVTLFQRNQAAQLCSPSAQRILKEFYLMLLDPNATEAALAFLLRQAAARAGFSGGAITVRDPSGVPVAEKVRFGTAGTPLDQEVVSAIASAAASKNPVHGGASGKRWMSAAIGETQRAAVLYLETSGPISEDEFRNGFRAVHAGAADALKAY